MAAANYFLKIDGIVGESRDSKHKGEIELESFSWGETQATPSRAGGGAAKVHVQDFHVTMRMDKTSPLLMLACASGQHLKEAILTARKAGKGQQEFLVYKLTDLLVSSYQTSAGPEQPVPIDQVSFNFGRIAVEYRPQRPDGSLDAAVKAGWDVKKNRKV